MPAVITTHVADAKARLLAQYQESPNILAMVDIFATQVQTLENFLAELIDERTLAAAVGVQLTQIGELMGLPRWASDDATYRTYLQIWAEYVLDGGATSASFLAILRAILDAGTPARTFEYKEIYPASFSVESNDVTDNEAKNFLKFLSTAKPAGVGGTLITWDQDEVHTFDSTHGAVTIEGWFTSTHGATSDPHGFANAVQF